jgi:hypothetical protein
MGDEEGGGTKERCHNAPGISILMRGDLLVNQEGKPAVVASKSDVSPPTSPIYAPDVVVDIDLLVMCRNPLT